MPSFLVPDDFRAFMRSVVASLDAPGGAPTVDAEDAFQDACGYGGRIDGAARYRFHYLTIDGVYRWTVELDESEIRLIVDGLQIEAEGQRSEIVRKRSREPSGPPLIVWGAYDDDALLVHRLDDLIAALETLHQHAYEKPRIVRLWSSSDDQLVAAMWQDVCALYVIESADGYATSTGDAQRTDAFEVPDHEGHLLAVRWADCVPWQVACRALIRFAGHGELGPEVTVEGRIPSQLLMHGELDRETVLASRAAPAGDPRSSSLPRLLATPVAAMVDAVTELTSPVMMPGGDDRISSPLIEPPSPAARGEAAPQHGSAGVSTAPMKPLVAPVAELTAWGHRLLQALAMQGLLELGAAANVDEIAYQLSGLLQAHGDEAQHGLELAEWLGNELGAIRGVARMFATGGDLQVALRRTRGPEADVASLAGDKPGDAT